MSYIPKQTKLTKERLEAKVETGLLQKLERYCEYLDSDRDYIITQALEIAFRKDKGFSEWLASQEITVPVNVPTETTTEETAANQGVRAPGRELRRARASTGGMGKNGTEPGPSAV